MFLCNLTVSGVGISGCRFQLPAAETARRRARRSEPPASAGMKRLPRLGGLLGDRSLADRLRRQRRSRNRKRTRPELAVAVPTNSDSSRVRTGSHAALLAADRAAAQTFRTQSGLARLYRPPPLKKLRVPDRQSALELFEDGWAAMVPQRRRCRRRACGAFRPGCSWCCSSCPPRLDARSHRRTRGRCSHRSRCRCPTGGSSMYPR